MKPKRKFLSRVTIAATEEDQEDIGDEEEESSPELSEVAQRAAAALNRSARQVDSTDPGPIPQIRGRTDTSRGRTEETDAIPSELIGQLPPEPNSKKRSVSSQGAAAAGELAMTVLARKVVFLTREASEKNAFFHFWSER